MIKELTDKYLSLYSGDNSRITTDRKGNTLIRRSPFRGYLMGEGIASSAVFPLLRDSLGATCKVARFPDADYPVDAYMIPGPIQRLEAYFSKNPNFGGWETVVQLAEGGFAAAIPQIIAAMREREMTVDDVLKLVQEAPHPVTGKLPGEEWV